MPFSKGNKPICPFKKNHKINKGRIWNKDSRKKASESHRGKKLSEEHKSKISKSLKGKIPKNIEILKNYWRGKIFSEDLKNKLSKVKKGKKTGLECIFWKGGVSKSYWRKKVLEKDNFTCQKCGIKDMRVLTTDHIRSKSIYPNLEFDVDNGMTLCANCHLIKTKEDGEYINFMNRKYWKFNGKKSKNYKRKKVSH